MTQMQHIGNASTGANPKVALPLASRPQTPGWYWSPWVRYPLIALTYLLIASTLLVGVRLAWAVVWSL